jgi:hypothetical protein
MSEWELKTPVAFFVFNRPDTTAQLFAEITRARPPKLLIIADGPRPNRPDDVVNCAAVRRLVQKVDWDCEVLTNFSETNMGCRNRVSSGLDWVFQSVPEAIILEDDCLPTQSFFRFCQECLRKYSTDTRIMQICGFNRVGAPGNYAYSYLYSKYGPIWGWATWSRAWSSYDVDMSLWPKIKADRAFGFCENRQEVRWRTKLFDQMFNREIDTWDYQWVFAKAINQGLSVVPSGNLISNIGFGANATHTTHPGEEKIERLELEFPLKPPPYIVRHAEFDAAYLSSVLPGRFRLRSRIKRLFQRTVKFR